MTNSTKAEALIPHNSARSFFRTRALFPLTPLRPALGQYQKVVNTRYRRRRDEAGDDSTPFGSLKAHGFFLRNRTLQSCSCSKLVNQLGCPLRSDYPMLDQLGRPLTVLAWISSTVPARTSPHCSSFGHPLLD
ncbi:DNA (cytosine-5)-methyltransferase CMT1 [Dorcoceras hygrometricum]|uniref:DNA (Cytosine-5)-methyltransferase CMT1 n=1 Tax=Dorcoceras hygrometricum TaxID=472368 RepID=A0A2Z7DJ69_9LAMI|nr:DNA (cytosine-5)-methyltransferase CMT1 [Dorcoceras hygrometricum]